mmetsp:Transcript_5394/g.8140  ORF Transcript_5394/g.8140 Transcript_5394/m.8140 type:complete len:90 (+) Transcript_5394:1135-1404(+)
MTQRSYPQSNHRRSVYFLIVIFLNREDVSVRAVGVIGDLALLNVPEILMTLKNAKIKYILDQSLASEDEEMRITAKWAYEKVRTNMADF